VQHLRTEDLLRLSEDELQCRLQIHAEQARCLAAGLRQRASHLSDLPERLKRTGVSVLTSLDAAYPSALLDWMADPPTVLYLSGDAAMLRRPLIAVANSNHTPPQAAERVEVALSRALELGFVPVTGHNRAEYQHAALVARRRGGPVCYVLDRGVLPVLEGRPNEPPFGAARIWPHVEGCQDLIVSPFAPDAPGVPGSNKLRDRVILALATCIVASYVRQGGNMAAMLDGLAASGKTVLWVGDDPPPLALSHHGCVCAADPSSPLFASSLQEMGLKDPGT
jgi:DNA processing protein